MSAVAPPTIPSPAAVVDPGVSAQRAANRKRVGAGNVTFKRKVALIWKLIRTSPWYHQLFIVLVLVQFFYLVIQRSVLLVINRDLDLSKGDSLQAIWFFGIIVLSGLFVSYYAIDALLTVNAFEMWTFFAGTGMLMVRLIVEYINRTDECRGDSADLCLVFVVLAILLNVGCMGLCIAMYQDLRWKKYKAIGADVGTQALYRRYEIFAAVRKLDLQVSVVSLFSGAVFFSDLQGDYVEVFFSINIVLFITELVWEYLGSQAVKYERRKYMYAFWALSTLLPAFIIAVAADAFGGNRLLNEVTQESVFITIGCFGIFGILNRIYTVANSIVLYRTFGPAYQPLRRLISGQRLFLYSRQRVKRRVDPTRKAVNTMATGQPTSPAMLGGEERRVRDLTSLPGAMAETPTPDPTKAGAGGGTPTSSQALVSTRSFFRPGDPSSGSGGGMGMGVINEEYEEEEMIELTFVDDDMDTSPESYGVVVMNPLDMSGGAGGGGMGIELPDVASLPGQRLSGGGGSVSMSSRGGAGVMGLTAGPQTNAWGGGRGR